MPFAAQLEKKSAKARRRSKGAIPLLCCETIVAEESEECEASLQTGLEAKLSSKEHQLIGTWFFGPKTQQNSQILHPAERFSDVTGLCHRSVFGAKSAQNGQLREVCFFRVRRQVWCPSLLIRSFSAENRLQTLTLLWIPFSAWKSRQIPSRRACHRSSPLRHRSLLGPKSAQNRPSSRTSFFAGFSVARQPAENLARNAAACRGPGL